MPAPAPPPLPIVTSETENPEKVRETFQNLLIYLRRISRTIFDSSVTDTLGAQVSAIQARPKDIYTFPLGSVAKTPEDPGYAVTPLDAVSNGSLLEAYARGQKPAGGTIAIQIYVAGNAIGMLGINEGADRARVGLAGSVAKGDQIKLVVLQAPDSPGFDDAVVQVLVG
jgi:hypothetical protein